MSRTSLLSRTGSFLIASLFTVCLLAGGCAGTADSSPAASQLPAQPTPADTVLEMPAGFAITRVYKEHVPALRLIGKRYTGGDAGPDGFGAMWGEWFEANRFAELERLGPSDAGGGGYLGLMTFRNTTGEFAYWIGILFPSGMAVPEGFDHLDLPESDLGIAWVYGDDRTGKIYGEGPHTAAYDELVGKGWDKLRPNAGGENTVVFFERYNGQRFTTRDDKGNVILDYGFYIE